MNRRRNPTLDIFIEVYKAYPANYFFRDEIETTNSIILPPTALQKLTSMQKGFTRTSPVLFRILNIELNMYTHCGVYDFTAEDDTCIIPTNMFNRLGLEIGKMVNLKNITLEKGTLIKIQPHKTEFIKTPNPIVILENKLRDYFCLTEGDTIMVEFYRKNYLIDIVECKPKKAITTINCDIIVDFLPPKDYVESPKNNNNKIDNQNNYPIKSTGSGNINFSSVEKPNKKATQDEVQKKLEDKKKNEIKKNTDDPILNDLIRKLDVKNPKERINSKDYFNEPFFKVNDDEKEIKINDNNLITLGKYKYEEKNNRKRWIWKSF